MKKPEYIEITLPVPEKYFKAEVVKYFKCLDKKSIKINFSHIRRRKDFNYIFSSFGQSYFESDNGKKSDIFINFSLRKEE